MELVILARLKWDLAAVTPYSFLEHLLRMMADTEAEAEDRVPERVKKIAETTIILCATEYRYNTTVKCPCTPQHGPICHPAISLCRGNISDI